MMVASWALPLRATDFADRGPEGQLWLKSLETGRARGQNILLITLDTTRADRLGCYGYAGAQTPNLDAVARSGIRFEHAIAHTPITQPSHASILTGLVPPHHGVRLNGPFRLAAEQESLAEILKRNGYQTGAFVSAFVLDKRFGFSQGFDLYDDRVDAKGGAQFGIHNERSARSVTDAAIHWIENRDRKQPFFSWVHYFDPHEPYAPPPPYSNLFAGRPYDGEIAFMDAQIGRLFVAMKQVDAWHNTLVIVVGDHGESLGEHGEPTHSLSIYDATQRVPLMIRCEKAIKNPAVVRDAVVAISDVVPTVLDLLAIDSNVRYDGISLKNAYADPNRMVYIESLPTYFEHGWAPLFGLRRLHDKVILAPKPEYFDLRSDPNEVSNLYGSKQAATQASVSALRKELGNRLAKWPSMEELQNSAKGVDSKTLSRLESLGYVSSPSADGTVGQLDPKDMMVTWTMLLEAQQLSAQGRLKEALAKAKQAEILSPRDRSVYQRLGDIYTSMRRYDLAEQAYRKFNEIMPNADTCVMLAQMIMVQRRLDEVEAVLQQGEELEPEHGGLYIVRGDVLAVRGQLDKAIEQYEKAIKVDPYRAREMAQMRIQFTNSRR